MMRWDIINHFIKKNNYRSYLEIGYYKGWSFDQVICDEKTAIDPNPCKTPEQESWIPSTVAIIGEGEGLLKMTSDSFFAMKVSTEKHFGRSNDDTWDIIFIDGLHEANQVMRDIVNSLKYLSEGGMIILHDCNPPTEAHTTTGVDGCWTGDTYKAWIQFRERYPNVTYTIDTDWGVGVIKSELLSPPILSCGHPSTWEDFDTNRKNYLNLISVEEFLDREKFTFHSPDTNFIIKQD